MMSPTHFLSCCALALSAVSVSAVDFDFGDAPAPYPVTLAEGGARHASASGLALGTLRNVEEDGVHHGQALSATEGDDGVLGPVQWPKQTLVTLRVTVNAACKLDAWIDWQRDGAWEGGGTSGDDRVALAWPLEAGENLLTVYVPAAAVEGVTYARFRVSANGGLATTGLAGSGEVEDYPLLITAAPAGGVGLAAPVLAVVATSPTARLIRWAGDPAYSSQMEYSRDLGTWTTFGLPRQETAGVNEVAIPGEFLVSARGYFRLVRRGLVSSGIPLPPAPTANGLPHEYLSQTLVVGGIARKYRLHLPHNWTPTQQWPLVMLCPGHGQSAEQFWNNREEMRLGLGNGRAPDGSPDGDPNDGWILCFAEATSGDDSYQWHVFDNPATYTAPFTPSAQPWLDDYAFVKTLADTLLASGLNIDAARVYAAGFSNGGSMCHYMASKADHPFAAFAMIDSGVPYLNSYLAPGAETVQLFFLKIPPAAKPRPVLINNQLDSIAWPYEGRTVISDPAWNSGVISVGAMGAVARWTVGNGLGGTATFVPPSPAATPADYVFIPPPSVHASTQSWTIAPANWDAALVTARENVRVDPDWPMALAMQPGWTLPLALKFPYGRIPPIPAALRTDFPHAIIPDPAAEDVRVRTIAGTWRREVWRTTLADPSNEVVLVTISDGAHNWPDADSPWNASVEVLRFFEQH